MSDITVTPTHDKSMSWVGHPAPRLSTSGWASVYIDALRKNGSVALLDTSQQCSVTAMPFSDDPLERFQRTTLWRRSLGTLAIASAASLEHAPIERLRSSFLSLREKAGRLAEEIAIDNPSLTRHDQTHFDALWEMADLLVGKELLHASPAYLNPVEAYVLGAAFVVHDLAQSRAAISKSDDELAADVRYQDNLISAIRKRVGPTGRIDEAVQVDKQEALSAFLRQTHADNAQNILSQAWIVDEGESHYLIDDVELRISLGSTIGRIAASHHWAARRLSQEFDRVGCPPSFPFGDCDLLKLACILRCADVIQLDARRAPPFSLALHPVTGVAAKHWEFQKRLQLPTSSGDQIVFTSGQDFGVQLAEAWWLGYDMLAFADIELLQVDALLNSSNRQRWQARSIQGAGDPKRLSMLIRTSGWTPVDTEIKVSKVAEIIRRLGGEELYGDDPTVALRELIQNACDATLARARLLAIEPGPVLVKLNKEGLSWFLTVCDEGLGMSENLLTGALLDFGTSYWQTEEARKDHPGLMSSGFQPTGRYGIGFFSVFMLGDDVTVLTRRFDHGIADARILRFSEGISTRPLLTVPADGIRVPTGTQVRIRLRVSPRKRGGLLGGNGDSRPKGTLQEICAWLCPMSTVTLHTVEQDLTPKEAVRANDWVDLPAIDYLKRVHKSTQSFERATLERNILASASNLAVLFSPEGQPVGRACIFVSEDAYINTASDAGVVCVGGFRSGRLRHIGGSLLGVSSGASRNHAVPLVDDRTLQLWASAQASLISAQSLPDKTKEVCASTIRALGGDVNDLPVAEVAGGSFVSKAQVVAWARNLRRVVIVGDSSWNWLTQNRTLVMNDNVIVCTKARQLPIPPVDAVLRREVIPDSWGDFWFHFRTLQGVVMEAVAEAWGMRIEEVIKYAKQTTDKHQVNCRVAADATGNPVLDSVDVLIRPKRTKRVPSLADF